ncbi:MAG: lytic transglycosylase domain-containing protein, partial [Steroidobacteraceae bacterium]
LLVAANYAVQVARKPSELFFPVSDALNRTPTETWRSYGPLFEKHSTARVSPTFLAALAQVEASGNPIVRTYWRWRWSINPFEIYRPASSAVGLYQLIDGTYDQARRLCIHDHVVVEAGAWNDVHSCWFNALYTRTVPGHAIEMTSAYLDRQIGTILARHRVRTPSAQQIQHLAAVIHLCGAGAGSGYARRGFRFGADSSCGDHSARVYLSRVDTMKRTFDALAAAS